MPKFARNLNGEIDTIFLPINNPLQPALKLVCFGIILFSNIIVYVLLYIVY